MSLSMKDLFMNLKEGDLLMIPMKLPMSQEKVTFFSTVLRIGKEGSLYLSYPDEHRATPCAFAAHNPFRWDPDKGTLVDKHGDVPRWYSLDIALERGGAIKQAEIYAKVPRLEHLSPNHAFTDADFKRLFLGKDDRVTQLEGILKNGEAGSAASQLLLALDVMGVQFSQQQAMGFTYFMERFAAKRTVQATFMTLSPEFFSGDDATEPPKKH